MLRSGNSTSPRPRSLRAQPEEGRSSSPVSSSVSFYNRGLARADALAAIAAAESDIVAVNNVEACGHRFVIGYTFGVRTPDYADNHVGKFNLPLFDHFEVAASIDSGMRRNKRDKVYSRFGKLNVGDFYDTLGAEASARKVIADGHASAAFVEMQKAYGLEKILGGNMVDDCSVGQCGNCEFFFIGVHRFSLEG